MTHYKTHPSSKHGKSIYLEPFRLLRIEQLYCNEKAEGRLSQTTPSFVKNLLISNNDQQKLTKSKQTYQTLKPGDVILTLIIISTKIGP